MPRVNIREVIQHNCKNKERLVQVRLTHNRPQKSSQNLKKLNERNNSESQLPKSFAFTSYAVRKANKGKQTKGNSDQCQKDCVNLKDSSKKATVHQPAVNSQESGFPQHINTPHHNNSQSSLQHTF